jgi:hypothetical protein
MRWSVGRSERNQSVAGRWLAAGLAAGGLLGAAPAAADVVQVVRVEEDWELYLNEPSDAMESPQFHTIMSPKSALPEIYFQATWNYRDAETYAPGGLQVQIIQGEEVMALKEIGNAPLSTVAETVKWTQEMELNGGSLKFTVKDGQSSSWGSFGGSSMQLSVGSSLQTLNDYRVSVSMDNSWITYGSNRVNKLQIRRIRYYGSEGLLHTDESPKVVFQLSEN